MNPYSTLWVDKWATDAEIKKAYRKKAMKWHPDKNKWNASAEKKFKEVNNAYDTLKNSKKRQQYDTFWDVWWAWTWSSWFSGWYWWGWGAAWTGWFEDMFSNFSQWQSRWAWSWWWAWWFDFSDLFGWWAWWQNQKQSHNQTQEKELDLDVTEIVEVPVFDLILGTKINVMTVYNDNLTINIKSWFKPWKKLRVKWKGRSSNGKTWDLYIKVEAKMPDNLPEDIRRLLEDIKYRI